MSIYLKEIWEKYGGVILIVLAVILIATISFRVGQIEQEKEQSAKIKISLVNKTDSGPVSESAKVIDEALKRKGLEGEVAAIKGDGVDLGLGMECALVASKNSTKYHLPNCKNATRIKDSNRICFPSEEQAKKKGYERAKCCHK